MVLFAKLPVLERVKRFPWSVLLWLAVHWMRSPRALLAQVSQPVVAGKTQLVLLQWAVG